jgi:predicted secreted acid phosphatase
MEKHFKKAAAMFQSHSNHSTQSAFLFWVEKRKDKRVQAVDKMLELVTKPP